MATDAERSTKQIVEFFRLFQDHAEKSDRATKAVAGNIDVLVRQMDHGHRTVIDYLKTVIRLPAPFQEISRALIRTNEETQKIGNQLQDEYRRAQAAGKLAESHIEEQIILEGRRMELSDRLHAITGKHLATEYLLIRGFTEAIKRSGEVNQSIISANSAYAARRELTNDIYEVQAKTGISLQETLAASKALASVWPKTRDDFGSVLETVVMMQKGLGVSYDHSVQLARVFQISLKTPVREVADQIAIIANSTSLAADEATRFATEIGKAIRLLGPGASSQVKEVTRYVTTLAGRMQDVGGDANEIVKMFSEMTKGTSQGFMLRGLAGVTRPGAIATEGGSQAAFQGINRMINRLVSAAPGTMAYVAQLENASQILGTTTENLVLFRRMMEEANKPLDEHAKLQQRWREQTEQANEALGRIRHSFEALIQRAFVPIIPLLTSFFGAIANIIGYLASHQASAYAAMTIFGIAAAKTIHSLYQLAGALWKVTVAATATTRAKLIQGELFPGFGPREGGSTVGPFLSRLMKESPWLSKLMAPFTGIAGVLSKIGKFAAAPPVIAGLIGAAVGVALGRIINHFWPENWINTWSSKIAQAFYDKRNTVSAGFIVPGQVSFWEVQAKMRRAMGQGDFAGAKDIFQQHAYRTTGLTTKEAVEGFIYTLRGITTELRERAGQLTEIIPLEEQQKFNQKQLEQMEEFIKSLGDVKQILIDTKAQQKAVEEIYEGKRQVEKLKEAAEQRHFMQYGMQGKGKL